MGGDHHAAARADGVGAETHGDLHGRRLRDGHETVGDAAVGIRHRHRVAAGDEVRGRLTGLRKAVVPNVGVRRGAVVHGHRGVGDAAVTGDLRGRHRGDRRAHGHRHGHRVVARLPALVGERHRHVRAGVEEGTCLRDLRKSHLLRSGTGGGRIDFVEEFRSQIRDLEDAACGVGIRRDARDGVVHHYRVAVPAGDGVGVGPRVGRPVAGVEGVGVAHLAGTRERSVRPARAVVGGVLRGRQRTREGVAAAVGDIRGGTWSHCLRKAGDLAGAIRAFGDAPRGDAHMQEALSLHVAAVAVHGGDGESDVAMAGVGQGDDGFIGVGGSGRSRHAAAAVTAVDLIGHIADRVAEGDRDLPVGAGAAGIRGGHGGDGGRVRAVRADGHRHRERLSDAEDALVGGHRVGVNLLLVGGVGERAAHGGHHLACLRAGAARAGGQAPRVAHAGGTVLREDELAAAANRLGDIRKCGHGLFRLADDDHRIGHGAALLVGDMEGYVLGEEAGDGGGGRPAAGGGVVLPGQLAGAGLRVDARGAGPGEGVLSVAAGDAHRHAALAVAGLRGGRGREGQRVGLQHVDGTQETTLDIACAIVVVRMFRVEDGDGPLAGRDGLVVRASEGDATGGTCQRLRIGGIALGDGHRVVAVAAADVADGDLAVSEAMAGDAVL